MHEDTYLIALLKNDPVGIQKIYDDFFPRIRSWVVKNSGSTNDAQDIFQDALVIIFKKAKTPDFRLTSSFYTFLYGVSWNLWLKQLRKKSGKEVTLFTDQEFKDELDIENELIEQQKRKLFREKLDKLTERCQKIMGLFFRGEKMEAIAVAMGFKNKNVAKHEKHKCQNAFIQLVKTDSRFEEFY